MTAIKHQNNFATNLTSGTTAGDTTSPLNSIPTIAAPFYLAFDATNINGNYEVVYITSKTATNVNHAALAHNHTTAEEVRCVCPAAEMDTWSAALGNYTYRARAYRNGAQTISDAGYTKIQLNAETYDTNNNFDSSTNYRYVAPITGYYQVNGKVDISGTTEVYVQALIYVNNAAVAVGANNATTTSQSGSMVSDIIYLAATDYVELFAYSDVSAGSPSVTSGSTQTYLSIHCLSS